MTEVKKDVLNKVTNDDIKEDVVEKEYKMEINWTSVMINSLLHLVAIYGLFLSKQWKTIAFVFFYFYLGTFGVTASVHRFFSHKSYKANRKLTLLLVILQTITFQYSVFVWALKHRIHHKFTDTNADPHNSKRGFFFAHIGWMMVKKHPDIYKMGLQIDMSDLKADPIVMYQHRNYYKMMTLFSILIPVGIIYFLLNESFAVSFCFGFCTRHVLLLHCTWLINSLAHSFGSRPYTKNMSAAQTRIVSFLLAGEGWHNYHHSFPWDYKSSELPTYLLNSTTAFIEFFAWIGWATNLRTASAEVVKSRIEKLGDGSHPISIKHNSFVEENNNNIIKQTIE